MKKGFISIIIPVYNTEKYLKRCLESVINQTYSDLQIICIDDGSTDGSIDILEEYSQKDKRIQVVRKENSGISETRNAGHSYVSGEYIMYLDSDDWLDENACESAINSAEKEKADVIFWNYVREFNEISKPQYIYGKESFVFRDEKQLRDLHRRFFGLYGSELKNPEKLDSIVTVWGTLYRSDIILKRGIKFVDTSKVGVEDLLFNIHFFDYVKKAVYLGECFNHYRKTNEVSFTKKYKSDFSQRLATLYKCMEEYIQNNRCEDTYRQALYNRICINIIGKGMNILRADKKTNKLRLVKEEISSVSYRCAIKKLTLKYFPIHWKIFFGFAKCNCALGVYIMLKIINVLK